MVRIWASFSLISSVRVSEANLLSSSSDLRVLFWISCCGQCAFPRDPRVTILRRGFAGVAPFLLTLLRLFPPTAICRTFKGGRRRMKETPSAFKREKMNDGCLVGGWRANALSVWWAANPIFSHHPSWKVRVQLCIRLCLVFT